MFVSGLFGVFDIICARTTQSMSIVMVWSNQINRTSLIQGADHVSNKCYFRVRTANFFISRFGCAKAIKIECRSSSMMQVASISSRTDHLGLVLKHKRAIMVRGVTVIRLSPPLNLRDRLHATQERTCTLKASERRHRQEHHWCA